jgi:exodeoxyribonuclease-5
MIKIMSKNEVAKQEQEFKDFLVSSKVSDKFKSIGELTDHQKSIFIPLVLQIDNIIKTGMNWDNIVSLSGPAGVGKTFVTSKIIELFDILDYSITITAPTHKAVRVISNMLEKSNLSAVSTKTIQSFLNLKQEKCYDTGKTKFIPDRKKDVESTDILIVDESSMVGKDLYQYIIQAIEHDRCKAVLFIGDVYQLPAIEGGVNPVFSSKNQYKLSHIVRQAKDSYIIDISTKTRDIIKSKNYQDIVKFIQENTKSELEIFYNNEDFINDFTTPHNWYENDKVLTTFTNNDVDYYNRIIRSKYWERQNVFNPATLIKGDTLVFQSAHVIKDKIEHQNNEIVQISEAKENEMDIPSLGLGKLYYWECKNRVNNKTFNVLDPRSKMVFKEMLDKIAKKAKAEKNYGVRKKLWENFFILKDFFADVKYSFASTIHKLQGSTYDTVYIDLTSLANSYERTYDKDLFFRLIYVAITRASSQVKILLPSDNSDQHYKNQKDILSTMSFDF